MASSSPERAGLLYGQLALVTGAASGIGRAIARGYAREGARVVLTDLATQGCDEAVAEIQAQGGQAWAFALDVTDVDAVQALADRIGAEIGDIDVLVNSAGILIRKGIDSPQAHAALRRVVEVNLFGCFNTIHAFLPALRRTRGNIINIASGAAFIAQAGCVGYSSSKAGLKMLTETMALDGEGRHPCECARPRCHRDADDRGHAERRRPARSVLAPHPDGPGRPGRRVGGAGDLPRVIDGQLRQRRDAAG